MASTKASRKAKRQSSTKGNDSDTGSAIIKARKAHDSKEAITKGAVKKSNENAKAKQTREYIAKVQAKQHTEAKEAQVKKNKKYVLKKTDKPLAQNGRNKGRQLIRWNVCTDQILLLIIEYELKRHGIVMPWDAIAKRLASEKETTGACVQQHLTKLRKEMLARGSWVPPLSGKPGNKYPDGDVRGYVMVKKRNNESELREILWTEDAFLYVDLVHINKAKMFETTKSPGKGKRPAADISDDEMDPVDLPSEEEFDPSTKKSKSSSRITRLSANLGGNSKGKTYDSDADADADADESDSEFDVKQKHEPEMMKLYESEEEEEGVSPGMVVLHLAPRLLDRFPEGVNQPLSHTSGVQVDNNNTPDEETNGDSGNSDNSGHGENSGHGQPYSIMDANTPENFADAFGRGQPYSVMDANTEENYRLAFGNGQPYSVMDANTAENYHDAFGGGDYSGEAPAPNDGYDSDDSDTDDSETDDSDSDGDHRGNAATGNATSLYMAQSSNPMVYSGSAGRNGNMVGPARRSMNSSQSNRSSMSNQNNNRHAGRGSSMGNVQDFNSANNSSGQTVYEVNGIGYNPAQAPNARELLLSAFADNAERYDGMTFAQIVEERQALLRANGTNSGIGFVMGNTIGTANNSFVSSQATRNHQMGGMQTGTSNNLWTTNIAANSNRVYQNNGNVPMNGYEMNGGNNENVTPEPDDNQHPSQGFMDGYEDFYGHAVDVLPFGNY